MTLNLSAIIAAINKLRDAVSKRNEKKYVFSGSTNGMQIKVVATATPGTIIHTARAGINDADYDELWLYAVNSSAGAVKLTIEWGTATAPDGNIEISIPAESGYTLVIPGLIIRNALVIKAFAATANVILVNGYVKRPE